MALLDKLFDGDNLRPCTLNRIKLRFLLLSLFVCCIARISLGQDEKVN
jgi:hypothetical protein